MSRRSPRTTDCSLPIPRLALCAILLLAATGAWGAETYRWNGGGGVWASAANWDWVSGDGVDDEYPGYAAGDTANFTSGDAATISSFGAANTDFSMSIPSGASVTLNASFTCGAVTLGGTLSCGAVATAFGAISGTGSFTASSTTTTMSGLISVATFNSNGGTLDMNAYDLTASGGANSLSGTIQSTGGASTISIGATTLYGTTTSITSNGGDIQFTSTVTGNTSGGQTLNLTAGAGAVSFAGQVGATALAAVTVVSSGTTVLRAVTTSGAQSYTASTSTTLYGTLTVNTAGAGVAFAGPVLLGAGGGAITLTGTNAANDVTFSATSTVNGAQALSITAGGGDVTFAAGAVVGGATPPTSVTVVSSGTTVLRAVTTSGAQSYTASTSTTLYGTLTVNTAGAGVAFTGPVLLGAGGGAITLTGTNAANDVTFSATSTVNGAQALSITAGGGDVTFAAGAVVGGATPPTSVTVGSGANIITLGSNITTTGGAISLTGTASVYIGASITLATGSGDPATAGAITFGTRTTSATGTPYTLTLDTRTGGATGGAVTIAAFGSGGGSSLQNLTIRTAGATTSGAVTAPAAYSLVIPGTTTLDIAGQSLTTLTNAANNFGTVAITNADSVSVRDSNAMVVGASVLTGTLSIQTGGNLTQSGIVDAAILATNNSAGYVRLDSYANVVDQIGAISNAGRVVSLRNTTAMTQVAATGITAGSLRLIGTGQYTLTSGTNAIGTIAAATSADLSYRDSDALVIGSVTGTAATNGINIGANDLSIQTGAALTQSQAITADALTLATVAGATLNSANAVSSLSATNTGGGNVQLTNTAAPLTVTTATTTGGGGVTISNTGALTTSGAVTASGANAVTVTSTGNMSVGGAVTGPSGVTLTVSADEGTLAHTAGAIDGSDATLELVADKMALSGGTIGSASTDTVILRSYESADAINVGSAIDTTADTLELSDGELDTVTGALTIGATTQAGAITVSSAITHATAGAVTLTNRTGGIAVNAALGVANALTLTATGLAPTGAVNGAGTISASGLTVYALSGIGLTGASTVTTVTLSNTTSGNISYTNSNVGSANTLTVAGSNTVSGGSFVVTETTGSLTVGAAGVLTNAGAITLTATGADETLTATGNVRSNNGTATGAAIALVADDLALTGAVNAGTGGAATLRPYDTTQVIDVGNAVAGTHLDLTSGELNLVTAGGGATIGATAQTGQIIISGVCAPTNTASWTLVNNADGISIRANFTATTNLSLNATGGGSTTGSITRTTGTLNATGGNLVLTASSGIGVIGGLSVEVGTVGGNLTATNNTGGGSGDLYVSTTGDVMVGVTAFGLTELSGGTLRVDCGGDLTIGGNVSVGGAGTVALNAAGTIARPVTGTVSAATVTLGADGATAVGSSGLPIVTAATTLLSGSATSGAVYLSNTGNVNVTASASGLVDIGNAGTTTVTTGGIVAGTGATVTVTSTGNMSVNDDVTGPAGITLTVTGGGNTLTHSAGTIGTTNSAIGLRANVMAIGSTVSSGTSNTYIFPNTTGTAVSISGAAGFDLTAGELNNVTAGTIVVGQAPPAASTVTAGTITLCASGAADISNRSLTLVGTSIVGSANRLTTGTGTLTLTSSGGIGTAAVPILSSSAVIGFANTTAGVVYLSDSRAAGTSASGTNGAANQAISLAKTAGALTIGGAVTSNGSGPVYLIADDMAINDDVTAGSSGNSVITSASVGQGIYIGSGATALGLSMTELNRVFVAGTLTIGDAAHSGLIQVDGTLTLSGPTGPLVLQTSGGNIQVNGALATVDTLTLSTTGSGATSGQIAGAAQITVGAGGASSLTAGASTGISLTNTGNLAATIVLSNDTSGDIALTNNRSATLTSALNNVASGDITIVNRAGALVIGTATSGTGGYVSISSAGAVTQSGLITAPGGLVLLGAGSFALDSQDNAVGTMAANVSGAVALNSAGSLTVGTVNGTGGVTTSGGNVSLTTASGDLTLAQPVSTGAGTVALSPAASIYLGYATNVITTSGAAVSLTRPVVIGENSVITAGTGAAGASFSSTIADDVANTDYIRVNGDAIFGGNIGGTALASVRVTGATTTGAGLASIATGGTQQYDGLFTLGADLAATASSVAFGSSVAGGGFSLAVTGDATLGGAATDSVANLSSLSISGACAINANAITTTSGGQSFASGGGATTLSAGTAFVFTAPAGQLVDFGGSLGGGATARSVTIATADARFDGDVGGAGNLVSSLSVDGATSMGAVITTSGSQTYAGAVTLSADSSAITGTGALDFQSSVGGSYTLTIQDASSTGDVVFAGALGLTGLTVGAGAYDIAINGGGTVTDAVAFANTGDLTITAGLTATDGITSVNGGTNTFAGTLSSGGGAGQDVVLDDLTVGAGDLIVDLDLGSLSVSGTLAIPAARTLDLASSQFAIGTLSNLYTLRLTGQQSTHSVTSHDVDSGAFEYYGAAGGTVFTTGLSSSGHNYYDLVIAGSGTFLLEDDLDVANDLTISGGVLDASTDGSDANSRDIVVGRNWSGLSGYADYEARNGTVRFDGSTIHVYGDNAWWIFYCHVDNATIYFENERTQRIVAGGVFNVQASSSANRITLNRETSYAALPSSPPVNPGEDYLFWFFDLRPGATFSMNWVEVFYSNARANPVNVPGNVWANYLIVADDDMATVARYDYKWLNKLYAIYSFTEDTDYNGKIDRIRISTESAVGTDFSGFVAEVEDYTIDTTKGTNGYARAGSLDRTLYIYLVEKNYNDTGAEPRWRVSSNTSLVDQSTGTKRFGTLETGSTDYMTAGDTAWPTFGYTLAVPSLAQQFIHLSEYVTTSSGGTPSYSDLGLTGAATFTTASGNGVSEACGPGTARTTAVLTAGTTTLTITSTLCDMGHAPAWSAEYDNLASSPDNPRYPPSTGYGSDPDTYDEAAGNDDADRPAFFDFANGGEGVHNTHRVSDLLVSVQPSSVAGAWSQVNTDSYFAWPIYAIDQVSTTLTEAEIEDLTPSETAAQGIGLIRGFDGTQWLRDQDWRLQVRDGGSFGAPTISYDSNVGSPYLSETPGIWLPSFLETDFSGLAGSPDSSVSTKVNSSSAAPLYYYDFLAADPKVFSVAHLDFYFHSASSPSDLFAGRLAIDADATEIPANWFRLVSPFSLDIHDVRLQKGNATILNNVIDPTRGDTVRLSYQIERDGPVVVTVFTLDGDVVRRLVNERKTAGDYATSWNGRNLAGSPVARGMYFIRIVAPGIDEIRKVIVVRR